MNSDSISDILIGYITNNNNIKYRDVIQCAIIEILVIMPAADVLTLYREVIRCFKGANIYIDVNIIYNTIITYLNYNKTMIKNFNDYDEEFNDSDENIENFDTEGIFEYTN